MKNNNDLQYIKNKYLFLGFIIGIIPFLITLAIVSTANTTNTFKSIIIIFGLVIAINNAILLRKGAINKLKSNQD